MDHPTEKQIDELAVEFGLLPPEEWKRKQITDSARREKLVATCGPELGNHQADNRSTGKTTLVILKAVWYARQGHRVAIGADRISHAKDMAKTANSSFDGWLVHPVVGVLCGGNPNDSGFDVVLNDHPVYEWEVGQ